MEQKGFTLIEMMVVVAMVGINNTVKQFILKNPLDDNQNIKSKLEIFVSGYKMNPKIAEKYNVSVHFVNKEKPRAYSLVGVPKTGTGYTLSVWMNSVGDGYKCRDAASARTHLETLSSDVGCEAFSNRKK